MRPERDGEVVYVANVMVLFIFFLHWPVSRECLRKAWFTVNWGNRVRVFFSCSLKGPHQKHNVGDTKRLLMTANK